MQGADGRGVLGPGPGSQVGPRGTKAAQGGLTGRPGRGGGGGTAVAGAHLIAPLEHVLVSVLDGVVDVQKLEDPVPPHVVGVALGLLPAQRRALGQQPHGRPLLPLSGADGGRTLPARGASRTLSCPQEAAAAPAAPPRGGALGPQSAGGGS